MQILGSSVSHVEGYLRTYLFRREPLYTARCRYVYVPCINEKYIRPFFEWELGTSYICLEVLTILIGKVNFLSKGLKPSHFVCFLNYLCNRGGKRTDELDGKGSHSSMDIASTRRAANATPFLRHKMLSLM